MITESITTKMLYVTFLALTPSERWGAAKSPFGVSSAVEKWLAVFAMAALIASVILVFWLSAKNRRCEDGLRHEIARLTVENDELRQELDELNRQAQAEASEEVPLEGSEEPAGIEQS